MSLRAPFLVKQYLSDDVESGSYSKIFWYHPLNVNTATQGGIGLFFEVLTGDVDDSVYEQITKRFWESFTDNFYSEGFEQSLKKSIKTFIGLLQNFEIEEGLDVNIVLFNVVESEKFYTLKLISFGDADIFVVRDGKFADMGNMVPHNESLYDLKFLEVELDKGDVLMLGNKTLLRNAFEADMIALDGIAGILRSLEEFKENLFGSKKLLLVAANEGTIDSQEEVKHGGFEIGKKLAAFKSSILGFLPKSKPVVEKQESSQNIVFEEPVVETIAASMQPPAIVTSKEVVEKTASIVVPPEIEEETPPMEEDILDMDDEPKPQEKKVQAVIIKSSSPEEFEQKPDDESHVVDAPKELPGRSVSVDDFVVTEEVTPAMTVEKSEYKDLVSDAIDSEPQPVQLKKAEPMQSVGSSVGSKRSVDYVNEFRSMRSPWAKMIRSPFIKNASAFILGVVYLVWDKILVLLGKKSAATGKRKVFLSNPTSLEPRKIQPGVLLIGGIVILLLIFRVRGTLAQKKLETKLLTELETVVGTFNGYYEQNIAPIDTEDIEHQLETCVPKAAPVLAKEKEVSPQLKNEENQQKVSTMVDQVKARVAECEAKYDRIYGIIRVRDAELIYDFKTSLGADSSITALDFYKGYLAVTDVGRKAVYQVNIETRNISRFEDPLQLVSEPTTLGTGEGILFVCDRQNGVLYYSTNATDNKEGFVRIAGSEPNSIGECAAVDGYAQNAYVIPTTANVVYKLAAKKGGGYEAPQRYITDLTGARALSIDGSIYVASTTDGKGRIIKFYGGKQDSFSLPDSVSIGELLSTYSNPSNERNIYAYDKTMNAIYSIEKPASNRHAGRGVIEKTYLLLNENKFKDIKSIAVDLNGNNQEVYLYLLAGSTIWRIPL